MTPTTNSNEDIFSFDCYKCRQQNNFNRSEYIGGDEEIFLEAAGTPPTKEILISCGRCSAINKILITLL